MSSLADLQSLAGGYANQYNINPNFFSAMIGQESSWNPYATNGAAQGLGQFIPSTASSYGITNPFNASQSLNGAASYFSDLLGQNGGDYIAASQQYGTLPSDLSNLSSGQMNVLNAAQAANAASGVLSSVTNTFSNITGGITGGNGSGSDQQSWGAFIQGWMLRAVIIIVGMIFIAIGLSMFKTIGAPIRAAAGAIAE